MGKNLSGAANRVNRDLQHRLSQKQCFGQSKHEAKEKARVDYLQKHGNLTGYNPSKLDGIYSIKTMESYRQTAQEFAIWAAKNNIKNGRSITKEAAGRYLQERQTAGKSAWTISKDMAALNKILGYDLTKKELGLSKRSNVSIKRSRNPTENDKRKNDKYENQITFAKATGCRRESVTRVKPSDFRRNAQGKVVAVTLKEKGGKTRTAPVLNGYKEKLTAIVNGAAAQDKSLFKKYDSHIDNHAFRSQYAVTLMQQLEDERAAKQELCGGDFDPQQLINLKGTDAATNAPYRGHDRDIAAMVSGALGHNRLCIVFESYIR